MSIGYACLTVGVKNTDFKTTTKKFASKEKLEELIAHNLATLRRVLEYNDRMNVRLFRISSDIIPFGSSQVNTLAWSEMFAHELADLGAYAREKDMRLSMHPGQYTVLNSPDDDVVKRAIEDLDYHCLFLDAMGMPSNCKLILHVGGAYGNKQEALSRFAAHYQRLSEQVKARLVLENDDKIYNISEVYDLAQSLSIPVVFDTLHHEVNPDPCGLSAKEWLAKCASTWGSHDGRQKIHHSQQAANARSGSHSSTIAIKPFMELYNLFDDADRPDIMLEVKDKNLSAVKCITATSTGPIRLLEEEWARYKYSVLAKSSRIYNDIRALLKDKSEYPAIEFYQLIEEALSEPFVVGSARNAAQHVWGYFKADASENERKRFDLLNKELSSEADYKKMKSFLLRLANKYGEPYLINSLYFDL